MQQPKVFVWSDQHFFHLNIIKYSKRPFAFSEEGLLEQNKLMLANAQQLVSEQDLLIFLGDIAFTRSEIREDLGKLFAAMPGRKILLKGNHDTASDTYFKNLGIARVYPYLICGEYFLCHYPLSKEPCSRHEALAKEVFLNSQCKHIIHGHTHNMDYEFDDNVPRWNVCVDYGNNNYQPLLVPNPLAQDLLTMFVDIPVQSNEEFNLIPQ